MSMYQKVLDQQGNLLKIVIEATGTTIPPDAGNADYQAYLAWVAAGNTPDVQQPGLPDYQAAKCSAIDAKTTQLLTIGFIYNGSMFALDDASVVDWHGVMIASNELTYPFTIGNTSGKPYNLINAADVTKWYAAGVARRAIIKQGGMQLKAQVNTATTQTAVDAVVDNRS